MIEAVLAKSWPAAEDSAAFSLDLQFTAAPGVTVLFGPSGAGKTLTLDLLAGFVAPDRGRIELDGRLLFDSGSGVNLRPQDRNIGYVFQQHALFPHMTLRENLAFAAHRLPRLERHRRIVELLERFRLTDLSGRLPRELSGGQKQRASIARALIARPAVLLFDEPGRGLDAMLRADLHALILGMKQTVSIPMLLVTHDLEECLALADNVLVCDSGRIVHRSAPLELLLNPGSVAVARLLGDFNIWEAEVLALDPGRQSSRIRMLGTELDGPHLRGCFRGDRVTLAARPEELRLHSKPGANRIRADLQKQTERPQSIRADFGDVLIVDVPRSQWLEGPEPVWVEVPASALRQLSA